MWQWNILEFDPMVTCTKNILVRHKYNILIYILRYEPQNCVMHTYTFLDNISIIVIINFGLMY